MDIISSSKLIIINDNIQCRGQKLFLAVLKQFLCKFDKVLTICDEFKPADFKLSFENDKNLLEKLDILSDEFCDPDLTKNEFFPDIFTVFNALKSKIDAILSKSVALTFDSLTPFLILYGVEKTIQLMHKLHRNFDSKIPILAVLHSDSLLNVENFSAFKSIATTWYEINWDEKSRDLVLHSIYFTNNRKRTKKLTKLEILDDFSINLRSISSKSEPARLNTLNNVEEMKQQNPHQSGNKQFKPEQPVLSTFNLNINEKDYEAKKNLFLPYLKNDQERKESGNVIYYADKEDDIDEEDPDDDLDI